MRYETPRPGDDLNIPADIWAGLVKLLAKDRAGAQRPSPIRALDPYATDVVRVQNTTSDAIDRNRIIFLETSVIDPADTPDEFLTRVVFAGAKPTADAGGRWAVLLDAMAPDQVGRAVVVGVVPCWVNLSSTADKFVDAQADSYIALGNGSGGPGQILWVAGGVGTATASGEQWAIIRIGGGAAALPRGQYPGMFYGDATQNQTGFVYPFLVELL